MAAPCALFTSCSACKPEELVKLVLDVAELSEGTELTKGVYGYPWHIDNKYYTADVHLCTTHTRTIGNQEFADSVQALIIHFDATQTSSFELVKAWLPYVEQLEPAVQILVADSCTSSHAVSRVVAQSWCVDNGFELVELNPEEHSDDEEEDDFQETTGVKRIVQALHAHTWPNLTMKDRPAVHGAYYNQLLREAAGLGKEEEDASDSPPSDCKSSPTPAAASPPAPSDDPQYNSPAPSDTPQQSPGSEGQAGEGHSENKTSGAPTAAKPEPLLLPDDDMALLAALGNEDPGEESFEQMFERLRFMKEKAMTLPDGERHKYAEQVVMSFWRAMGGDEEEIEGLDD